MKIIVEEKMKGKRKDQERYSKLRARRHGGHQGKYPKIIKKNAERYRVVRRGGVDGRWLFSL